MANKKKEESNETIDIIEIKNDLVKYIDSELDKKIDSTFNQKIRKEFIEEIDNSNRRLIREKNKRNLIKNIIIVILILIICYLINLLYKADYFDKYFIKDNNQIIQNNNNISDISNKEENIKPTLEELKEEYGNLLDNIIISKDSAYINDFYQGDLNENLKKYLALNLMNFEKIEIEEDYNVIESKTLEIAYKKLFESKFTNSAFEYNGIKIRYISKLDSYLTDNILTKSENNILSEITEINVDDKKVYITTVEGIIEDECLYNILTNEEVEYYDNDSIINYENELNKITYVFENKKLISLEKDK